MEALPAQLVVVVATAMTIALAVLVHFEGLVMLGRHLARRTALVDASGMRGHWAMLWVIAGLLVLHGIEIGVFGMAYWGLSHLLGIAGTHGGLVESVYLSATAYSTVGFGDVEPVPQLRFLVATESVVGLLLITWSGSFTFIEMSRHWRSEL
jgi:hypothetical protein